MAVPGNSLVIAERVLYELLGRRWVWPPNTVTEEYKTDQNRINVRGRPIISVDSVVVGGEEIVDFTVQNRSSIVLPSSCTWAVNPSGWYWGGWPSRLVSCPTWRTITIVYTYGSQAPEMIKNAIQCLAEELDAAYAGNQCRLPSRVTEVVSRGISMTILDPMDFLDDGLTGIPEVDLAIRVHNPAKARTRARVFAAPFPPGQRITEEGS